MKLKQKLHLITYTGLTFLVIFSSIFTFFATPSQVIAQTGPDGIFHTAEGASGTPDPNNCDFVHANLTGSFYNSGYLWRDKMYFDDRFSSGLEIVFQGTGGLNNPVACDAQGSNSDIRLRMEVSLVVNDVSPEGGTVSIPVSRQIDLPLNKLCNDGSVVEPTKSCAEKGMKGYRQRFGNTSIKDIFGTVPNEQTTVRFVFSILKIGTSGNRAYFTFNGINDDSFTKNIEPRNNQTANSYTELPDIFGPSTGGVSGDEKDWDVSKLGIDISGLRTKYRASLEDPKGIPVKFNLNWPASMNGDGPRAGQKIKVRSDYNALAIRGVAGGVAYFTDNAKELKCADTYSQTDCTDVVPLRGTVQNALPGDFTVTILKDGPGGFGTEAGEKAYFAWPLIDTTEQSVLFGVPKGSTSTKFIVEVFKTNAEREAACVKDQQAKGDQNAADTCKKDPITAGEEIKATVGSSEKGPSDPKADLFDFIRKVITYIVITITGIIYRIFSFILVPVLNALLSVHPYEDVFVNVIYPGWIILRNLANIAFIVSLLVMGLRIIFQQDDAAKSRGFIIRLVLAALLVNFSLVIAQGIVAIADTVQSQFLPANSKVVETLGQKLMVDPIIAFNCGGTSLNSCTDVDLNGQAADIFKPIMLLILSLAAFFTFVALIGFIFVRLVALWILYLTSPVAYFGSMLSQTSKSSSQWWSEFVKYVSMVPIIAFFLNIAALLANTFALSKGSEIPVLGDNSYLLSGAANGVTDFALTVVSHFIVLIFLFMGMNIALKSGVFAGTVGTKAIVDFAKKGFKNTYDKWPKKLAGYAGVGKDYLANKAATAQEKNGRPGLAKAITAVAKPLAFGKAFKDAKFDQPKKERLANEARRLGDIFPKKGDTSKMGTAIKGYRDAIKDHDSDDPGYLADLMKEGFDRKDGKKLGGAMLKLGQEGKFKDILDRGGKLMGGKNYTKNAAGLNAFTADLVAKKLMSEDQRRDLLNEFDKTAKKKASTAHYGGNVHYDADKKKSVVRNLASEDKDRNESPNRFEEDGKGFENANSWTRKQVEARTEGGKDGGFFNDLKNAHTDAAVRVGAEKGTKEFTDTQIGVIAKQSNETLKDAKAWANFRKNNGDKLKAMRDAHAYESKKVGQNGKDSVLFDRFKKYNEDLNTGKTDDEIRQQIQLFENGLYPEDEKKNNQGDDNTNSSGGNDDDDDKSGGNNGGSSGQGNSNSGAGGGSGSGGSGSGNSGGGNDDGDDEDEDEDGGDDDADAAAAAAAAVRRATQSSYEAASAQMGADMMKKAASQPVVNRVVQTSYEAASAQMGADLLKKKGANTPNEMKERVFNSNGQIFTSQTSGSAKSNNQTIRSGDSNRSTVITTSDASVRKTQPTRTVNGASSQTVTTSSASSNSAKVLQTNTPDDLPIEELGDIDTQPYQAPKLTTPSSGSAPPPPPPSNKQTPPSESSSVN